MNRINCFSINKANLFFDMKAVFYYKMNRYVEHQSDKRGQGAGLSWG